MKAKTLIELMTLSTNLYMISKDDKFMKNVEEMTEKGKEKISDLIEEFTDDDVEGLWNKISAKAAEAKIELDHKIEEIVVKTYEKMKIAHANDLKALEATITKLKTDLESAEARISDLESL